MKDLAGQYFYQNVEGMIEDIQACRPAMEELARLVREFFERYEEKKRTPEILMQIDPLLCLALRQRVCTEFFHEKFRRPNPQAACKSSGNR